MRWVLRLLVLAAAVWLGSRVGGAWGFGSYLLTAYLLWRAAPGVWRDLRALFRMRPSLRGLRSTRTGNNQL